MTEKQRHENEIVKTVCESIPVFWKIMWYGRKVGRLRTCNADVFDYENYYILRSYSTIVAVIDKNTGNCYDFLRLVYGYTNTSAQHIRKFMQDFGGIRKLTWHD